MSDACDECRHDWHGASKCGARVRVDVMQRMYFNDEGAGPLYAQDVLVAGNGPTSEASATCACRGH